jgi:hypothetical protein
VPLLSLFEAQSSSKKNLNSGLLSWKTQSISITNTNHLMLCGEILAVYSDNHIKQQLAICFLLGLLINSVYEVVHSSETLMDFYLAMWFCSPEDHTL